LASPLLPWPASQYASNPQGPVAPAKAPLAPVHRTNVASSASLPVVPPRAEPQRASASLRRLLAPVRPVEAPIHPGQPTAASGSAGLRPAVSQISNLPGAPPLRTRCRLEIGDTAGQKPALRTAAAPRSRGCQLTPTQPPSCHRFRRQDQRFAGLAPVQFCSVPAPARRPYPPLGPFQSLGLGPGPGTFHVSKPRRLP